MLAALFWLVLAVVCLAVEIHTNAFVALFAGFGAAFSFVLALSGIAFLWQAGAWLALSALSLALARPFAVRRYRSRIHPPSFALPTETAMADFLGFVEEPVGDMEHPGRVKVKGESWAAVTEWPEALSTGTPIVVRRALGTTLWVDPLRP